MEGLHVFLLDVLDQFATLHKINDRNNLRSFAATKGAQNKGCLLLLRIGLRAHLSLPTVTTTSYRRVARNKNRRCFVVPPPPPNPLGGNHRRSNAKQRKKQSALLISRTSVQSKPSTKNKNKNTKKTRKKN